MSVLAIDQGTTSTRALLLDARGEMRQIASLPHRQIYPAPGWVEHDPEELIRNIRVCLAAADEHEIIAVGIANQGESCLAWDAQTGQAISPVIVWQDDRTSGDIERMRRDGLEALVRERAGLPLDPYFSASKLAWILREIPAAKELHSKGNLCLGTTDAFFRYRFAGQFETDVTTASRTSLMNLATCQWDADLCAAFGVPMECLPTIGPSSGDLGSIHTGERNFPLTASLVDQQAALYGHGCRQAGDTKITFGTGAFALALTGNRLVMDGSAALPTVAWQKAGQAPVYALDGGVYTASSAINWALDLGLFSDLADLGDYPSTTAAERGLVFVPALAGLACPHWNRSARGAWLGLSLDTTRKDMMQAVLEGIAFRMAEVIGEMESSVTLADPISIDGGMSNNHWFCQFLADVLGRDLVIADNPELTALGAAQLAAEGASATISVGRDGRRIAARPMPPSAYDAFRRAREAVQNYASGRT